MSIQPSNSAITFPTPDLMAIRFERFGLPEYDLFLKAKRLPESQTFFEPDGEFYHIEAPARFAAMLGVEVPTDPRAGLEFNPLAYDDQAEIVRMALASKRFACWSDCGLGKTFIGLEFARHVVYRTGGRFLIVTLNEIVPQWIEECQHFYGDALELHRIESRQAMREFCKDGPAGAIGITNYEKWNPEDLDHQIVTEARHLAGIALDESNRLAMGGGKQKWAIIKSCRGIEYKLSLTATPAPNDTMEFASQASFLEKMRSEGEIIWTYFQRDPKTHRWAVKPHARRAFFEFMSSWSIYVRDPRKYGWRLDMPTVPEPEIIVHELAATEEQKAIVAKLTASADGQMDLFFSRDVNAIQANRLSQAAKGFIYRKGGERVADPVKSLKPGYVADLVQTDHAASLQVLVWTIFDAESTILAKLLKKRGLEFDIITGATKEEDRIEKITAFKVGRTPILISRASMLGFGMNFQCCGSMVFSGFSYSYVQFYQAIRRAYRQGQMKRVRVHVPVVQGLEEDMYEALIRKQGAHEAAIADMEYNYIRARRLLAS